MFEKKVIFAFVFGVMIASTALSQIMMDDKRPYILFILPLSGPHGHMGKSIVQGGNIQLALNAQKRGFSLNFRPHFFDSFVLESVVHKKFRSGEFLDKVVAVVELSISGENSEKPRYVYQQILKKRAPRLHFFHLWRRPNSLLKAKWNVLGEYCLCATESGFKSVKEQQKFHWDPRPGVLVLSEYIKKKRRGESLPARAVLGKGDFEEAWMQVPSTDLKPMSFAFLTDKYVNKLHRELSAFKIAYESKYKEKASLEAMYGADVLKFMTTLFEGYRPDRELSKAFELFKPFEGLTGKWNYVQRNGSKSVKKWSVIKDVKVVHLGSKTGI